MKTNIWTIGGFLGAGKTTLLMRLAGTLAPRHPKGLAIIANDVSQIGVDQRVLREVYPNVYELFDGCVCCQLSIDLIQTIGRIQSEMKPELILIEPSGIAEPARIKDTLQRYGKQLGMLRTLVVVDTTRLDELMETLEPLVTAQIEAADVLALNKTDIAGPVLMARGRQTATQLNPRASVLEISAMIPEDVTRVADEMMGFAGPTAHAAEIKLTASGHKSAAQWEEIIAALVTEIAAESVKSGATVIGHIKTFSTGMSGLRIYGSSTGPQHPPTVSRVAEKSEASQDTGDSTITVNLNAIVYGLSARELDESVIQAVSTSKERWGLATEIHREPHGHHHDHDVDNA